MTKKETQQLSEAQRNGYLVSEYGQVDLRNAYFGHCEKLKKPVIEACRADDAACVSIDFITTGLYLSECQQKGFRHFFRRYGVPTCLLGALYCSASGVKNEHAAALANLLRGLVQA